MEDVAHRERLVRYAHMFFMEELVSSRVEDVARRERLVWVLVDMCI